MAECRDKFIQYLIEIGFDAKNVIDSFDIYYRELVNINQKINLFSRKMSEDEIWQRHFMDSISIFEFYRDWAEKNVLDFGTGGGLPGIPIKIVMPSCKMTLLDSTQKKIECMRYIVSKLKIENISFLNQRIEGKEMVQFYGKYDVIVCRAVKITPLICVSMKKLLNQNGRIYLYKSGSFEDVKLFKSFNVYKLNSDRFSDRNIIEIKNG